MAIILKKPLYTIIMGADDHLYLRTQRRAIRFKSFFDLYKYSIQFLTMQDWMGDYMNEMKEEQVSDGLFDAFTDFQVWYETRKSRAKTHLRMVAKLLYWHRLSVEKLWDPSRPENLPRIMEMFTAP